MAERERSRAFSCSTPTLHYSSPRRFLPGIDTLLGKHKAWLAGKRIGLVSHLAAVDARGCLTAERLWRDPDTALACIMGPEHGFFGRAQAGVSCRGVRHPEWSIPVYSLYGTSRKPTAHMLRNVDVVVFDLQDLGARCYTYVSTLRLVLEAAAELDKEVVVADRPIPLPMTVDGPVTEPGFGSFVSLVETPLSYGMTAGEAARWINATRRLGVRLKVATMQGYHRQAPGGPGWPPWIPPSPAIVSWESARCFPATVCFEALGAIDHGRLTHLPFQVLGARWMNGAETAAALADRKLPGVHFYAHRYDARPREPKARMLDGVRMVVTDPARFRPVFTAVSVIRSLQELYGIKRVWARDPSRPDFFDKLMGTDAVRKALLRGDDAPTIAKRWARGLGEFRRTREESLLYCVAGE